MRYLEAVLDEEPLLSEHLLELAEWTAQYYLAPLGEVLRAMLPLMAEVRRTVYYRHHGPGAGCAGARAVDGEVPRIPTRFAKDAQGSGQPGALSAKRGASSRAKSRTWSGACWSGWPRASR